MPQAVVAAVVATGATWAGAAIAGTALAAGVLTTTFVTTLVLSGISMALTKKPKIPTQATMLGRSQMVKQPITSRKIVYGRQRYLAQLCLWKLLASHSICILSWLSLVTN